MQNIDYSKKMKRPERRLYKHIEKEPVHYTRPKTEKNSRFMQFMSTQNRPLPLLYLFLGAVLFFTSGLVIGVKIDQRETLFATNEVNVFKNVNPATSSTSESTEETDFDEHSPANPIPKENLKPVIKPTLGSMPKNLQYPPHLNQINYIIQLGNFSKEDAMKFAASLIREKQEFQGRIFRTSTGKLYLGYYYDEKEARVILKKIRKFQNGIFLDATVKNIQF